MNQEQVYGDVPSMEVTAVAVFADSDNGQRTASPTANPVKRVIFKYLQPAILAAILAFWWLGPKSLVDNPVIGLAAGPAIMVLIMALEWVNERHAHWRLTKREFADGLFFILFDRYVISAFTAVILYDPLRDFAKYIGTAQWGMSMPFILQVAMIIFLHEFVQYWFHRLLHNHAALWEIHVPHHYVTQMNTMNAAVGNWIEIIFLGVSLIIFFDVPKTALLCAGNIGGAVAYFAHSNIRFDPPRWYSYLFTTIESHSLHHSLEYEDTRCNYANELILLDRMFGTFRDGEAVHVGQDNQRRLSVWEHSIWPFLPLIAKAKAKLRQRRAA